MVKTRRKNNEKRPVGLNEAYHPVMVAYVLFFFFSVFMVFWSSPKYNDACHLARHVPGRPQSEEPGRCRLFHRISMH